MTGPMRQRAVVRRLQLRLCVCVSSDVNVSEGQLCGREQEASAIRVLIRLDRRKEKERERHDKGESGEQSEWRAALMC